MNSGIFKNIIYFICINLFSFLIVSCNSRFGKVNVTDSIISNQKDKQVRVLEGTNSEILSYQTLKDSFFSQYCTECHSSDKGIIAYGVDLDDYKSVKQNITNIFRSAIIEKRMPLGGTVSEGELALLKKWIDEGAIEFPPSELPPAPNYTPEPNLTPSPIPMPSDNPDPNLPIPTPVITSMPIPTELPDQTPVPTSTPTPTLIPSPDPDSNILEPTFSSIEKNIFNKSCNFCHNEKDAKLYAKGIILTKDGILNSNRPLVKPGFPEESILINAISRADNKRMPPFGMTPLTVEQIDIIKKWILDGAN